MAKMPDMRAFANGRSRIDNSGFVSKIFHAELRHLSHMFLLQVTD
jgi:hypothetical protein